MGKNIMITAIHEEALEAIQEIKKHDKSEILVDQNFNIAIFNILWRIASNQRFPVEDLKYKSSKNRLANHNYCSKMINSYKTRSGNWRLCSG